MGVTVLVFEKNPFKKWYVLQLFTIDLYGEMIKIKTKIIIIQKRLYLFFSFLHMFWALCSSLRI